MISFLHSILRPLAHLASNVAFIVALSVGGSTAALAGGPADRPIHKAVSAVVVPDRYIIKLRDGADATTASTAPLARLTAMGARHGKTFQYVRAMSGGAHVVRVTRDSSGLAAQSLAAGRTVDQTARLIATQLMDDPDVQYADPDIRMVPMLVPNDAMYSAQWDLYEAAGGIDLPAAWDITTGSAAITVAVIDTGYLPHADLAGRFVQGYDFIHDASISNDGDARDTDASDAGDYCGGSASSWHGTHVSGTIGAIGNNGTGIAGINWVSKILPARVLGACGGYTSDIIDAMRWSAGIAVAGVPANANPARVENLSLGGSGVCLSSLQSAVNDVIAKGTVIVVAAGNSNEDVSTTSPANCTGVLAVAATTRNGGRAGFSNFGTGVAIAAPGVGILSTLNTGTTTPGADSYASYSGTSMATPHVVGVVSLMLSQNPSLTPAQVKARLQATARAFPTGTGNDCTTATCGAGIVDAAAALATTTPPPTRTNVALASSGTVATASSVYSAGYPASGANNGDRKGLNGGSGGYWNDGSPYTFPDWIQLTFPAATTISEIDVFSVQDNFMNPAEPTESMTFSLYGLVNFDVQYWDGANWITVTGGTVVGNNLVWKKITFEPVKTSAVRVVVRGTPDLWSRVTELEVYGDALPLNYARSSNGGVASATSTYNLNYPPSGAIDGDRAGRNQGNGGYWNDATPNAFPDALQINFNATKSINEIDVFSVQDNFENPSEPTSSMTFTLYGLVDFDVQYWNGSVWVTVPNGSISGNNLVWRKITFPALSTTAIRINVRNALGVWTRVAEVEAYLMH